MNKFISNVIKMTAVGLVAVFVIVNVSACSELDSYFQDVKGSLIGDEYNIEFYDNTGDLFLTAHGNKIDMELCDDSEGNMSSVINITIDGHQMVSCGSTAIFADTRLHREVDFNVDTIDSNGSALTSVSSIVNAFKNSFGKPMVLVIQSQLGVPICAYSGDNVYWEVCEDLPKTTKLMVDGKPIYIHRANFQIIDLALL